MAYPNHSVTDRVDEPALGPSDRYHSGRVVRWEWSPAQMVACIVGILFVVLGGIALARTGIDFQNLTAKHVRVAGAGHTQVLAYMELGYGILMLAAASVLDAARGFMTFLGLVALAFAPPPGPADGLPTSSPRRAGGGRAKAQPERTVGRG